MDVFGNSLLKRAIIGLYEPLFLRRITRRAALIGALSKEHLSSSKIAQFVNWDKVVIIPDGVDAERFRPREADNRLIEKHGLRGKIIALFVGNFLSFKGIEVLLHSFSEIRDDRIVLLMVGGGYGEQQYWSMAKRFGLEKRVIFAGPQSADRDLPSYYNLSDFLILPSTHSESFGLVVLEAMASGKPAIVSALPGPSQLIDEGKDGLIVKVGDSVDLRNKIEYLASDRTLCSQMGESGRKKVLSQYRWEVIGELLEKTLSNILMK
jgi:phosphatidylinositol alpha-mannosyltransferase